MNLDGTEVNGKMMFDIIVIGGGIAGMSAAAELAQDARVAIVEMETAPGYHATGRSAAYFAPAYGNATVRNLTAASEAFFRQPPADFTSVPLLRDRSALFVAGPHQIESMNAMQRENLALRQLDSRETCEIVPLLKRQAVAGALLDVGGGDLDVDAILQGFRRLLRKRGGEVFTSARVLGLNALGGRWRVQSENQVFEAGMVVNAAGAWADDIARLAGLAPLGLVPKRRTALTVDAPVGTDIRNWPLVIDVDEQFYFKPDAGQLLISPADETPSEPCDAQPLELDVAVAIERVCEVTELEVRRVNHRWAGLRTFAPDKTFVVGFDSRASGFFWLAGQGGYGVQSAPGMAQLTRHLLTGGALAAGYESIEVSIGAVAPDRLFT